MSQPSSPKATPKRKRDDLSTETRAIPSPTVKLFPKTIFSFESPSSSPPEDGSSSPRTKVANKLVGLTLESGGGVATTTHRDGTTSRNPVTNDRPQHSSEPVVFDFNGATHKDGHSDKMQVEEEDESVVRKRQKHVDPGSTAPGIHGESSAEAANPVQIEQNDKPTFDSAVDPTMVRVARTEGAGGLKKSYPSINRLADSKSRGRKRTGTPPLNTARRKTADTIEEEPVIVDPVRANLTWHEDEITVYDANDKDDDGTGLNGIGFKPTPAIAYQRAQKRKKQLIEYKKREESEARALRNQKRREQLGGGSELERKHSIVRVHFSDIEPETLVTT